MRTLRVLLALAVIGGVAAAGVVGLGLYDVSATDQHLRPTFWLLQTALHRSVERRASRISAPPLGAPEQLAQGLWLYRKHCVHCHGAPGIAPEPFALALRPLPTPLARSGRDQSPQFIYWVVKHGIKMTGMPAFEFRMDEAELWATVAFVRRLPHLAPLEYQELEAPARVARTDDPAARVDIDRGRRALDQYACIACHQVPGQVGPEARLGPTLHGIGARETIGGVLRNTPENMALWLRSPKSFAPLTAMPNLGVTERDARDMAAYLATLK